MTEPTEPTEPTMRYRPDSCHGSTVSEQPHRATGELFYYKVFDGDEVDSCLKDGWYTCPSKFPKKRGPKAK